MITTHNTFWELPVSFIRNTKTLIHLIKETGSFWNFVCCDNGYPTKCMWQNQKMAWL